MKRTRTLCTTVCTLLLLPITAYAQRLSTAPVPPGSIKGEVFDSLTMRPVAKAFVFVPGTPLSAQADDNGRFTLIDVPVGTHFVAFSSPALDSLGLSSLGTNVDVRTGESARAVLATPSFRVMWKSLCAWSERLGPDSGIVWGTVRDADSDTRLSNAAAAFNWYDLRLNAQRRPVFSAISKTVRTDSTGTFYACGLPEKIKITTEAAGSHSASGTLEYTIGTSRLHRMDLLVSTDMVFKPGAVAKTAADSLALRARGKSSVHGFVRDANGKALPSTMVTIATTDSSVRTNAEGEFTISGLPSGTHMLQARQVGYSPASVNIDLKSGQTTETSIAMPAARTLATVNVRADAETGGRDRVAFEERRRSGFGYSMLLKDMENKSSVASVLREMPSVTVEITKGVPSVQLPGRLGAKCAANLWIDGVRASPEEIAAYRPEDFRAVEVYPREFSVPAQYAANLAGAGCGAVLFWSRFSKWQ